jgi:hypothetical protein
MHFLQFFHLELFIQFQFTIKFYYNDIASVYYIADLLWTPKTINNNLVYKLLEINR